MNVKILKQSKGLELHNIWYESYRISWADEIFFRITIITSRPSNVIAKLNNYIYIFFYFKIYNLTLT